MLSDKSLNNSEDNGEYMIQVPTDRLIVIYLLPPVVPMDPYTSLVCIKWPRILAIIAKILAIMAKILVIMA